MRIVNYGYGGYLSLDSEPVIVTKIPVRPLGLAKVVIVRKGDSVL